jgi:serine/threonine protein kinase
LNFCHSRGVAHGSLGPGSIMLSTFRDCQARELIIKLDNFGFAQMQKPSAPGEAASMLTAIPTPDNSMTPF